MRLQPGLSTRRPPAIHARRRGRGLGDDPTRRWPRAKNVRASELLESMPAELEVVERGAGLISAEAATESARRRRQQQAGDPHRRLRRTSASHLPNPGPCMNAFLGDLAAGRGGGAGSMPVLHLRPRRTGVSEVRVVEPWRPRREVTVSKHRLCPSLRQPAYPAGLRRMPPPDDPLADVGRSGTDLLGDRRNSPWGRSPRCRVASQRTHRLGAEGWPRPRVRAAGRRPRSSPRSNGPGRASPRRAGRQLGVAFRKKTAPSDELVRPCHFFEGAAAIAPRPRQRLAAARRGVRW